MPKGSPTITVRLPEPLNGDFRKWCKARGLSVTTVLRPLISAQTYRPE